RDSNCSNPTTAVIQISTESKYFLLYNNSIDRTVVSSLNEIMHNPTILKIIRDVTQDAIYLPEEYALEFCNMFDTDTASELLELPTTVTLPGRK
ncbi:unnamed protein product, partial [Didymodactylos carnosus]